MHCSYVVIKWIYYKYTECIFFDINTYSCIFYAVSGDSSQGFGMARSPISAADLREMFITVAHQPQKMIHRYGLLCAILKGKTNSFIINHLGNR